MKLIDLTHTFTANMPVYPGDTPPELEQRGSFVEDGCIGFNYKGGMHVGTHIDAPQHMIEGGKTLADFPVEFFTGKGGLVDARGRTSIDADLLGDLNGVQILVVCTGWYKKFREPDYYENAPLLTQAFAKKVAESGVRMVALDTPSPDAAPYLVHKILLGRDILIVENLNDTELLLGKTFRILAFPPKFEWEGAPLRVLAELSGN